ncbi:hypothetical protein LZ198_40565 [Myxococcus sp. K15C18031901]|uniref:hypothetical protein n=1 Tax=Myxococcus dinghuensis TaxID=2906761 RepID=UPI0020A7794D|nr:hypothetical protein [Myxococcus dinghuensis]MCP3105181.1 hypothetical protein [Myxococcus dinghuensis]
MPSTKSLLGSALAASLLWGSAPAEARFGRRALPPPPPTEDTARPPPSTAPSAPFVAQETTEDDDLERKRDAPRRRRPRRARRGPTVTAGASATSKPETGLHASSRMGRSRYGPVPLLVRVGVQGDLPRQGGGLGLFMAMEGRRLGVDARISGLTLREDADPERLDRLTVLSARATAALWASRYGRLRVEAGLASAHLPGIIFVGPSFGASLEACIGRSPMDIEARMTVTPFPQRQVDAQAGLAAHLGDLNLRGGWRMLYFGDAGHLDGVEHEDTFAGPYLGLGLTF